MYRFFLALLFLLVGCGASGDAETSAGDAVADAAGGGGDASPMPETVTPDTAEPTENPCPTGHVPRADGTCMPVGIQGCAEMFIDPETGLCDPRPEDCPPGHIPIFSEGCQSVSIPGCVEEFMDPETGLCDPSPEDCPPGYIPVFDEGCVRVGVVDCHPDFIDPETGHCDPDPDFCDPHHIPVPTQGCVSLDPPEGCGDGTWGNVELLDGDVHVDIAYAGGDSDGSRQKPFVVIKDATDAVADGGRVILAAGDYPEGVRITKSFEFVGRCASMVTISGGLKTSYMFDATLVVFDAAAAIRDVTFSGAAVGIFGHGGASLTVTRVAMVETLGAGIVLLDEGTSMSATDVLVAGTRTLTSGELGRGVNLEAGASMTLSRASLVDNGEFGLFVNSSGTSAVVSDVLIARTRPESGIGWGGVARGGASLTLSRAVLSENHGNGLVVYDPGSVAEVSDVVVSQTAPMDTGELGRGMSVEGQATLLMTRAALVDNREVGLFVAGDAAATVVDLSVARTTPRLDGTLGRGVEVQNGGYLGLVRGALVENHGAGLSVTGEGAVAEVSDVLVARTQERPDGTYGRGVHVEFGAELRFERGSVVENQELGFFGGEGAVMTLSDVLIGRTGPNQDGSNGRGIGLYGGASLSLTRGALVDNQEVGIHAQDLGTTASMSEVQVARTAPREDGSFGRGCTIQDGAALTVTRSALVENHEIGLFMGDVGTSLVATDLLIARTQPRSDGALGRGLQVQQGATVIGRRLAVVANHDAGILVISASGTLEESLTADTTLMAGGQFGDGLVAHRATLPVSGVVARASGRAGLLFSASGGEVTGCYATQNTIGLVIQGSEAFESLTVVEGSVFEGNEQNIMTDADLTVPDEATSIPDLPDLD